MKGRRLTAVAVSADGTVQSAAARNKNDIWTSADSGASWAKAFSNTKSWEDLAMSADGVTQTALAYSDNAIWASADSGASWTRAPSIPTTGLGYAWYSVAMSADGATQSAVVQNGDIWILAGDIS